MTACSGSTPGTGDAPSDKAGTDTPGGWQSSGDTGIPTTPPTSNLVSVACDPQPNNVLRYTCAIELFAAADVSVRLSDPEGGPERTFAGSGGTSERIGLYRMLPEQTYTWTVSVDGADEASGSFTTDPLPAEVAFTSTLVADPKATVGDVYLPFGCEQGWATVVDPAGRVVWYQDFAATFGQANTAIRGSRFSEDDQTLLVILEREYVAEVAFTGEVLQRWERGVDFDDPVHHDLFRHEGRTYVLNASVQPYADGDYVIDGVYVFAADGTLETEWTLHDRFDPVGYFHQEYAYWYTDFGLADDVSHGNSLEIDANGDWILSLRHLNSVIHVAGIDAADAGAVRWALNGVPGVPVPTYFSPPISTAGISPTNFELQHHGSIAANGNLLFLDNRRLPAEDSRILEVNLNHATGTADFVAAYDLGEYCFIEGGVFELDNGNLLGTCATGRRVVEFARTGEALWDFTADCGGNPLAPTISRAQGIAFPN